MTEYSPVSSLPCTAPYRPAGLKYKLACGSLVFKFDSKYREFYEPALQDGVHVVRLPATHEGVDPQQFTAFTGAGGGVPLGWGCMWGGRGLGCVECAFLLAQ